MYLLETGEAGKVIGDTNVFAKLADECNPNM
jgi:hypothetical protein